MTLPAPRAVRPYGTNPAYGYLALVLALSLGAALRLPDLGAPGLWVDEAYTAQVASGPLGSLLRQLRADDAPPFYYLLQAGVLRLLGTSEFAVRFLSALASLGTTALLFLWARRFGAGAAAFVSLTWSTSTLAIFYAQQARSYALLHLGVAALLLLGTRLHQDLDRRGRAKDGAGAPALDRRAGLAFAAVGLALLYTHNLAVWTLAAAWLWVLPSLRLRPRFAALLCGGFFLGALPWLASSLGQLGVHGELNAWMATWWQERALLLAPLYSLGVFANGTAAWVRPPIPLPALDPRLTLLAFAIWAAVGAGLVAAGLAAVRGSTRRNRPLSRADHVVGDLPSPIAGAKEAPGAAPPPGKSTFRGRTVLGPWLLLVAPFLGLLATTTFLGPAYVVGRTDTLALVPFIALVALGWARSPRPLGLLALVVWTGVGMAVSYAPEHNPKGTDRALASWLGTAVSPGDVVVVTALGRPTVEHYAQRGGWLDDLGDLRAFPGVLDRNPAAVFPTPLDSLASYEGEAYALRAAWESAGVSHVWLLATRAEMTKRSAGVTAFPAAGAPPAAPPAERATVTANDLLYPTSVLLYALRGLQPVAVLREYRQDWVGGERVAIGIPRTTFVARDSLAAIETAGPR